MRAPPDGVEIRCPWCKRRQSEVDEKQLAALPAGFELTDRRPCIGTYKSSCNALLTVTFSTNRVLVTAEAMKQPAKRGPITRTETAVPLHKH